MTDYAVRSDKNKYLKQIIGTIKHNASLMME